VKISYRDALAIVLIILPGTAPCEGLSTPPQNASYFCTVDFAGGLSFNENLKKWQSTTFRADRKFVLRLKFVASRTQKNYLGHDEPVLDFSVTITEAGSNSPSKCTSEGSNVVTVDQFNYVRCSTALTDYVVNLENNRFLASYIVGYVDGSVFAGRSALTTMDRWDIVKAMPESEEHERLAKLRRPHCARQDAMMTPWTRPRSRLGGSD
jgi:hypothetical protein